MYLPEWDVNGWPTPLRMIRVGLAKLPEQGDATWRPATGPAIACHARPMRGVLQYFRDLASRTNERGIP